ncbi:MAG TPA: UDP-glucose 4-epimerase GalE [Phycisphaerales bacterium]|nr:UDP-glucose 4-epimerase GalE [Phycisphaerales bacterium]
MAVMVTGGAGYIGSHAVKRLLEEGFDVLAVDNLYRGHAEAIAALQTIAEGRLAFSQTDVGDRDALIGLMREHKIDTVMHFAALAYVGESVEEPLRYYRNNTASALSLLEACDEIGIERFVFSSTCATYGEPPKVPMDESTPQSPISPYGMSKLHVEHMLRDYAHARRVAGKPFGYAALRYFNVAGSDPQTLIGEDHEPETHLIPVIIEAALGIRDQIKIFGTDYDTPDGTCIRDYIHVCDLIDAHIAVMRALQPGDERFYNLGIGKGYSVREIIESVRRVAGREFKVVETDRRPGDPAALFADPSKINHELGWSAKFVNIDDIVRTAWNWFESHPNGYES